MPRIMVFGKSKSRTRKVAHITRAFQEQGNETLWLNPAKIRRRKGDNAGRHILEKIEGFNPDIVFIYSQDIPLPVLKEISGTRIKTVLFYEDWTPEILPSLIERGRLADLFLVTSKGMIESYRQAGIQNPVFFTDACDRHDHRKQTPFLPLWKSDVTFIGQARPDEPRVELVKRLMDTCNVKIYGKNWEKFGIRPVLRSVGPRGYRLICGGARIVLGADIVNYIDSYWSNRLWLTLGCGGFLLTNYVPGMENFFRNREHLVWYHDEDECVSLAQEFLSKPDECRRIADEGYRFVHEHHTFNHFVERVLALCQDVKKPLVETAEQK